MILTNKEMDQVRQCIETQAGLDPELVQRCGHLIHMGAFDEAVRSAFVLLEERLKKATGKEGLTGTRLADYAFNAQNGPLSKHLADNQSEREGLRELYSGAFKLFRNPTAHSVTDYEPVVGKAIIGLVNLLLKTLERVKELPPPNLFPDNVETVLTEIERVIGLGATSRLRIFLGKCIGVGIQPTTTATQSIPFRRVALQEYKTWEKPRPYPTPIFYLKSRCGIEFNRNYYDRVVGFDAEPLFGELVELGFLPNAAGRLEIDLRIRDEQDFFYSLLNLLEQAAEELDETLRQTQ